VPAGVHAVVVAYHPDRELLLEQYRAVRDQVERVVYVDNSGGREALVAAGIADAADVLLIGSGANLGLATALNLALRRLQDDGAEYALLLDQDSLPDPGMVSTLLRGYDCPGRAPVAAVGPAIVDLLEGRPEYFARLRLLGNRHIHSAADAPQEFFDVDFLITSGTLVRLSALADIGPMDDSLFIDSVDFEWSFRARSRGYALLATFSATLRHRRGDELHRAPFGLSIRIHSPSRLYYMHRNRIRLYTRGYVPIAWKAHDLGRWLVKLAALMAFVPERRQRLGAVARGVRDGLRQRGGQ
jgi:rhamnosyltransferase